MGGKAATDALLAHLQERHIHHRPFVSKTTGCLLRLFVALPESIQHLTQNPDVLLMDATYKTNRFNMPLVDTVGIDSCNKTFFISFAFMSSETDLDYEWVTQCNLELYTKYLPRGIKPLIIATNADLALIKAVHKVFPNTIALLCLQHIQKNISKHCKGGFATNEAWIAFEKDYNSVFYAKTEQDYKDQL